MHGLLLCSLLRLHISVIHVLLYINLCILLLWNNIHSNSFSFMLSSSITLPKPYMVSKLFFFLSSCLPLLLILVFPTLPHLWLLPSAHTRSILLLASNLTKIISWYGNIKSWLLLMVFSWCGFLTDLPPHQNMLILRRKQVLLSTRFTFIIINKIVSLWHGFWPPCQTLCSQKWLV